MRPRLTGSDVLAAALRLLAVRDRTEAELIERLRRKNFPEDGIAAALQQCRQLGYVDDVRFARQQASLLMSSGRAVGRRLLLELRRRGLDETTAATAVAQAGREFSEEVLLRDLLRRRFPAFVFAAADDREKRRVIDFFRRRGFSLPALLSFFEKERSTTHHD
jgi:regulatory protein